MECVRRWGPPRGRQPAPANRLEQGNGSVRPHREEGRVAGATPRRLLIAESDPALRRLLAQRFLREGYEVTELPDPLAARQKVVADEPDVVVLELGGRNGFEALVGVREVSSVALIGMLWAEPEADEATALDLGADDCLVRPISFRHLVARTHAVLRRTAPPDARALRYDDLEVDL